MNWIAEAPSNVALIKYIGKVENPESGSFLNGTIPHSLLKESIPLNSSLSFTLKHLKTKIEIQETQETQNNKEAAGTQETQKDKLQFKPLKGEPALSPAAQTKFLNFFYFLKEVFGISGHYNIISQNNFPHSAGVASSASSFAALTLATYHLAKDRSRHFHSLKRSELARLSAWGSGSSSRSFFSPWVLWGSKEASEFSTSPWADLSHDLIVVGSQQKNKDIKFPTKKIPSTKAHQLVKTSQNFKGRPQRAEVRLEKIKKAFQNEDWKAIYLIVKEEFLDIHDLFNSSSPAFSYQTLESKNILNELFAFWERKGDGPLITMDAGPHIHLLYRMDQKNIAQEIREKFSAHLFISSDF